MDYVYENFYADKQLFDFSGYGKENPLYNDENKKVIGKWRMRWTGKLLKSLPVWGRTGIHWKQRKEEMKMEQRDEEERSQKGH